MYFLHIFDYVKLIKDRWNFLPGRFQPFSFISACGSGCGSKEGLAQIDASHQPQKTTSKFEPHNKEYNSESGQKLYQWPLDLGFAL